MKKGYFHSTTLMQSFLIGFFRLRQKSARGGLGLVFWFCFRWFCRRFAAADMVPATPAAASAVLQAELMGFSTVDPRGVAPVPPGPGPAGAVDESGGDFSPF